MSSFDLLTTVENGGCSAKIPPKLLDKLTDNFKLIRPDNVMVGTETHDDAAVWKDSENRAYIFTTDFFPPLCSDPYEFGQIAATNSLSDVYAMGGVPRFALNIVTFPSSKIDIGVLQEILKGGADKIYESGTALVGGHTIDDDGPPKYGLAVIGDAHPDHITANSGVRVGDKLILTKPLGTGTILAGHRVGAINKAELQTALNSMKKLNNIGAEIMRKYGVKGATDITGFSLLGHALKMAKASDLTIRFDLFNIPLFPRAYDLIQMGCIPGVSFSNLAFVEESTLFEKGIDYNLKMLAVDAQTSGGLLFAISSKEANSAIKELKERGHPDAAIIGEAIAKEERPLWVN